MPEQPPAKRRVVALPRAAGHLSHDLPAGPSPPYAKLPYAKLQYAELHAKSNYSFLEGASHPDELAQQAALLGYAALAVTDRNSLAGVVRAHVAAKEAGLHLVVGAEIWPVDAPPAALLATDRAAYGRLARLITHGRRQAPKGECLLTFDDVAAHATGLLACVLPPRDDRPEPDLERTAAATTVAITTATAAAATTTAAQPHPTAEANSPRPLWSVIRGQATHAEWLARYRDAFGDRAYALAEPRLGPDDARQLAELAAAARQAGVALLAASGALYHLPQRQALADVLTATRLGLTLAEAAPYLWPNAERHLHPSAELLRRFAAYPNAVERTVEAAARCTFSLDELRYEYPEELCPPGLTPLEHLSQLTWAGAGQRYPHGVPEKICRLIEHELRLIEDLHYEAYFLTVWDLVRFARGRDILCQGRGSAANSAVCYALGVTSVDPERIDVLFERFVSRERNEAPDIDVDFEHERREEVLQYLYEKYGRERAGLTAEVICYRPRSAVRDVGKALGLSQERVDALAKAMDSYKHEADLPARLHEAGLDGQTPLGRQLSALTAELQGFPRHLSQHVGGMVITRGPLCELVPIENAAMADRTVIQWDKDDLDALGILKVDCLALGMLTAIHKCFDMVRDAGGPALDLASVPPEDPAVYDMVCRADTVGVFQIESRAQMSMLPRLQPRSFYDLVIEVAIVRPGPIQGNMVHPYLRRRAGEETVEYPNAEIRAVLEKTLGVPIFQEQAMRLAVVAAGFTPGEADQLRRAMGAWRRPGVIEQFRQKLLLGMQERGLPAEFAERVFSQIRGFGEYGFPESHAASFARLVYVSAWLKRYYPAAFTASLLNSQPMGFYAPAQLIRDAQAHGVTVLPIDVNDSGWDARLEHLAADDVSKCPPATTGAERSLVAAVLNDDVLPTSHVPRATAVSAVLNNNAISTSSSPALRLGLRLVRGLPEDAARQIEQARRSGPFRSPDDLARRAGLGRGHLLRLSQADAFKSLKLDRRAALWDSLESRVPLPLFDQPAEPGAAASDDPLPLTAGAAALPALTLAEEVLADYQSAGLSLKAHPMALVRRQLTARRIVPACELATLPVGKPVRVAGLVLLRQRPSTANGITFVTLEDETGQANLVVRPQVWQRHHVAARAAHVMLAHGLLERKGQVIHVLVSRLENLSALLTGVASRSRDFR